MHESGDRYNDPSAPSGAYGILSSTASSVGLPWPVSNASAGAQDAAALQLYNEYGWNPWSSAPSCGSKPGHPVSRATPRNYGATAQRQAEPTGIVMMPVGSRVHNQTRVTTIG